MRCRAWQPEPGTGKHMVCDKPADHNGDHIANGLTGRWRWNYWPDYAGPELVPWSQPNPTEAAS